jgi:universal stress protein E
MRPSRLPAVHPIDRILVAIKDPRARHIPTIGKAVQLAQRLGAEICLFHAIADPMYLDIETLNGKFPEQLERESVNRHRECLERLAKSARPRGVSITTAVEWDYPAHEAVMRAAVRFGADLIVAECHRTHVAPWLLHFTDWELLRRSRIPVLLVKTRGLYHRPGVLAAIDPGHPRSGDLDEEILRRGASIACALSGALHAVHAYSPALADATAAELATARGMAEAHARAAMAAHAAVDPKLNLLEIPLARRHVVDGFAVDVIGSVAERIHAQIVLMGAVSRSGLKRLLIGNTAERMLDRIACDVLIVKPREFTAHIARRPRGAQIIAARPLPGTLMG